MVSVNDSSSSGGSIFWQWSYPKSTNKLSNRAFEAVERN